MPSGRAAKLPPYRSHIVHNLKMCYTFPGSEKTNFATESIIESPLINYRTAPASANIKSMDKRLELMRYIIEKHCKSYSGHMINVLLDMEAVSNTRLLGWENEIIHSLNNGQTLSEQAEHFIKNPSYGDGGMASAVRIVTSKNF